MPRILPFTATSPSYGKLSYGKKPDSCPSTLLVGHLTAQCKMPSQKEDRHAEHKERIKEVFAKNKGRYAYRRITMELRKGVSA